MTPADSEVREAPGLHMYKPPFRYERGYIWDADWHMVADSEQEHGDSTLRLRGWGRIQYMGDSKQAAALQDAVGERIAAILTEHWTRPPSPSPTGVEPVAWRNHYSDGSPSAIFTSEGAALDDANQFNTRTAVRVTTLPLYTTPPASAEPAPAVAVPSDALAHAAHQGWAVTKDWIQGWNDCRKSMLPNNCTFDNCTASPPSAATTHTENDNG